MTLLTATETKLFLGTMSIFNEHCTWNPKTEIKVMTKIGFTTELFCLPFITVSFSYYFGLFRIQLCKGINYLMSTRDSWKESSLNPKVSDFLRNYLIVFIFQGKPFVNNVWVLLTAKVL